MKKLLMLAVLCGTLSQAGVIRFVAYTAPVNVAKAGGHVVAKTAKFCWKVIW